MTLDKQREQFTAAWLKQHSEGEKLFQDALEGFFREQAKRIAAQVRKLGPHAGVDALFRPSEWDEALLQVAETELLRLALAGALKQWELYAPEKLRGQIFDLLKKDAALDELRVNLPQGVKDSIKLFLDDSVSQPYWLDINRSVRDELARVLGTSIDRGDNLQQAAKRVQETLGGTSKQRAELIVRTETTGALNAGHDATRQHLQDLGLVKGKEWAVIRDNDTRPEHLAANGQTVNNETDFIVGGESCKHPGDTRLSAWNRCNCRCAVITVLADEPSA